MNETIYTIVQKLFIERVFYDQQWDKIMKKKSRAFAYFLVKSVRYKIVKTTTTKSVLKLDTGTE